MAKYQFGPRQISPFTFTNMAVISPEEDEEGSQQSLYCINDKQQRQDSTLNAIFRTRCQNKNIAVGPIWCCVSLTGKSRGKQFLMNVCRPMIRKIFCGNIYSARRHHRYKICRQWRDIDSANEYRTVPWEHSRDTCSINWPFFSSTFPGD